MTKFGRQAARKATEIIPPVKRYLDEKRKMQQTLDAQSLHIQHLEGEVKRVQKTIEKRHSQKPRIRFIANQLDSTGASLIYMDVARDFMSSHPEAPADFITFEPVDESYKQELERLGFNVILFDRYDTEPVFVKGDVVVLNTVAYSQQLKASLYKALKEEYVKKLIWYMHEDWPDIFFDEDERRTIRTLIDQKKISIYIPAKRAKHNHEKTYAGKDNTRLLPYRIKLPEKYYRVLKTEDFEEIKFIMVGKTGEGLKGQLPILYAILAFKKFFYDKTPSLYRDFKLTFLSIEEDYLSLQIKRHAPALCRHFEARPPLPHDKALDLIYESNVTICYSMRECLPIFVFEGMAMGHPILRNDVSGIDEQLFENKNGRLIDSQDFSQVLEAIEALLNKSKTSNSVLSSMSKSSNKIAANQKANDYQTILEEIWASFN